MKTIYLCNEAQSNKQWSYEVDGNTLKLEWGRVGGTPQTKQETFNSVYSLQNKLDKVIREKIKKGYKKISDEVLQKETETAEIIGHRYKIQKVEFVGETDGCLMIQPQYNENNLVYVEILESWTKEVKQLLLSKSQNWYFQTDSKTKNAIFGKKSRLAGNLDKFVVGVRASLRDTFQRVQAAINKFAVLGSRKIDLGFDDEGSATEVDEVFVQIKREVGVQSTSDQVISRFASSGSRFIDIF